MKVSVSDLVVAVASPADATGMVEVIHAAFGARPTLDPPATAIAETAESVAAAISAGAGIYAEVDGQPAGALLITGAEPGVASFRRVSVHPHFQRHGIASAMVAAAEDYAAELGYRRVELFARQELTELVTFWQHRGFSVLRAAPYGMILGRSLPFVLEVPTGAAMQELGARLARLLRAGDLIIATGDLGAGKTTLTQGIGRGLGSEGPVISPTFVLARVHRSTTDRPALVHVDAYRLSSAHELDDLDLEASLPSSVTVVEWGEGLAEGLSDDRLEIDIRRGLTDDSQHATDSRFQDRATETTSSQEHPDVRMVIIRAHGPRWRDVDLTGLVEGHGR